MNERPDIPGPEPASKEAGARFDAKQLVKLAVEFGPLLVFFIGNSRFGIFPGTAAFMAATVVALIVSRVVLGKVAVVPLVTSVFVLVFGGLTLWLQDDHFIKIKPTIVNSLFAAILFTGVATGRSFLKLVFGEVMHLTEAGWRILTIRWACFFVGLAVLNEVIWRTMSTDFWVSFKVFGIMPLTFLFALAQIGLLKKYEAPPQDGA
jgi:intracellular septation protein